MNKKKLTSSINYGKSCSCWLEFLTNNLNFFKMFEILILKDELGTTLTSSDENFDAKN